MGTRLSHIHDKPKMVTEYNKKSFRKYIHYVMIDLKQEKKNTSYITSFYIRFLRVQYSEVKELKVIKGSTSSG